MHFIVQMNWQFLQNKEHSYFIYIHTEKFYKDAENAHIICADLGISKHDVEVG